MSSFTTQFQQLLYAALPAAFPEYMRNFLAGSLASLPPNDEDEDDPELLYAATNNPPQTVTPAKSKRRVPAPSPHLHRLSTLPRYATTLMRVAYDDIEAIAQEEAAAGWTERRLGRARQRVSDSVVTWMSGVFESGCHNTAGEVLTHQTATTRHRSCGQCTRASTTTCASRSLTYGGSTLPSSATNPHSTDELFDIIVDYPDSLAALEDLRVSCCGIFLTDGHRTAWPRSTNVAFSWTSSEQRGYSL